MTIPSYITYYVTVTVLSEAFFLISFNFICAPDSSVGIATGYGLDGPGIESRCGRCLTHLSRPWGPPSLLYNWYRLSFPEVKRPGRDVDHPTPTTAEVKETVELYLYSPSGPSWPVLRWTWILFCEQKFLLPFTLKDLQFKTVTAGARYLSLLHTV
jgi:hypothetical protein